MTHSEFKARRAAGLCTFEPCGARAQSPWSRCAAHALSYAVVQQALAEQDVRQYKSDSTAKGG